MRSKKWALVDHLREHNERQGFHAMDGSHDGVVQKGDPQITQIKR